MMSINQRNKNHLPTTLMKPQSRPSIILTRDPIAEQYATNSRHDRFQRKLTHYTMVNECNYQTQYYLKSRASVKREVIRHLEDAPNVIHPFSILRKWWEIIMIVVLFFAFIVIPYHASFIYDFNEKYGIATIVLNIIRIFCFIDIILNFCTGYYDKDRSCIILNMGKICKRYLTTYFVIDVISVLPIPDIPMKHTLHHCINNSEFDSPCIIDLLHILYNCKMIHLAMFFKYIEHFMPEGFKSKSYLYRLAKFILISMFLLHWIAALEFLVFRLTIGTPIDQMNSTKLQMSWTGDIGIYNTSKFNQYIHCLHRAIYTVTLYGHDIDNNSTSIDVLLAIFLVLLGFYLKIYFTVQVMMYVRDHFSSSLKSFQSHHKLQEYIKFRTLPTSLRQRLLQYFDYCHQHHFQKEAEMSKILGTQMGQEITLHTCRKFIESVPIFLHIPSHIQSRMISSLRTEIYLPNDVIAPIGKIGHTLYIIISGTVAVCNDCGEEVGYIEEGAHFGEIALLTDEKIKFQMIALDICSLLVLDRSEFLKAMEQNLELLKELRHMAEEQLKGDGMGRSKFE